MSHFLFSRSHDLVKVRDDQCHENGYIRPCYYPTGPNFRLYRSILLRFRDMSHFLFSRSHDLVKVKDDQWHENRYIRPSYYLTGPKFLSVLLYLASFPRYERLPVFKVTRPCEGQRWPMTWKQEYKTFLLPNGFQIIVRFALSRSISEIWATSCFQGHMTSWRSEMNNDVKIGI